MHSSSDKASSIHFLVVPLISLSPGNISLPLWFWLLRVDYPRCAHGLWNVLYTTIWSSVNRLLLLFLNVTEVFPPSSLTAGIR